MRSATDFEPFLWGRRAECERLDQLVRNARAGVSGALVIRGEAGIGKTALLDYLFAHANGCRVVRLSGMESEMELAFAGLHQVAAPFLDRLPRLPAPQQAALEIAFGVREGAAPDRFFVGLAVLSLLSATTSKRPLVCLVDDAQWLDRASSQIVGFVARRLGAESVVMIFGVREPAGNEDLAGLPELHLGPLSDADAQALLAAAVPGRLDASVRDRIVAEAGGNPLALLEFPHAWTPVSFAGGFGLPESLSVSSRIEETFRRRLARLPEQSRRLLLVAAAEPVGNPALIRAAAARLSIPVDAGGPAVAAGLVDIGHQFRFRHPLVRSVVYRDARIDDRRLVHRALAMATDAAADPDRRAWHLAAAATGPDESVAVELERSAGRAQGRGGLAAAAAFLERSVGLTEDQSRRAPRALAAAGASLQAGAFDHTLTLVALAEAAPLDAFERAQADLLRGHVAFAGRFGGDAPGLLLTAARRLEPFDLNLARETYLAALVAAVIAGRFAGGVAAEIGRAALALPPSAIPRPVDLLLEGYALLITDGRAAATPILQRAARAIADLPTDDVARWGWSDPRRGRTALVTSSSPACAVWDEVLWLANAARQVEALRDSSVLAQLPITLEGYAAILAWSGDFATAASLAAESEAVAAAIGSPLAPYGSMRVRALQGREPEASALIASAMDRASSGGQGMAAIQANWAAAVLYNGLARYEEAALAAREVTSNTFEPFFSVWALPELVEASTRTGDPAIAHQAADRLAEATASAETPWALGIDARTRALVSEGDTADGLYRAAIDHLSRTKLRPEFGRARLLYGEWLRREGRRLDAREQLRAAHDLFEAIGMEGFAERARLELLATGETARRRTPESLDDLTPQEVQIARLARDGRTNPEIGAQLFLSPRTVEWHMRNVFAKLDIRSRRQLRVVLARSSRLAFTADDRPLPGADPGFGASERPAPARARPVVGQVPRARGFHRCEPPSATRQSRR